jgi:hypothetical protein
MPEFPYVHQRRRPTAPQRAAAAHQRHDSQRPHRRLEHLRFDRLDRDRNRLSLIEVDKEVATYLIGAAAKVALERIGKTVTLAEHGSTVGERQAAQAAQDRLV